EDDDDGRRMDDAQQRVDVAALRERALQVPLQLRHEQLQAAIQDERGQRDEQHAHAVAAEPQPSVLRECHDAIKARSSWPYFSTLFGPTPRTCNRAWVDCGRVAAILRR